MGELDSVSLAKEQVWGHLPASPSAYRASGRQSRTFRNGAQGEDKSMMKQEVQTRCKTSFLPCRQLNKVSRDAVQALSLKVLSIQLDAEHPGLTP